MGRTATIGFFGFKKGGLGCGVVNKLQFSFLSNNKISNYIYIEKRENVLLFYRYINQNYFSNMLLTYYSPFQAYLFEFILWNKSKPINAEWYWLIMLIKQTIIIKPQPIYFTYRIHYPNDFKGTINGSNVLTT